MGSLGQMGSMGGLGGDGGMNPAGMMTGMMMGGAIASFLKASGKRKEGKE